MPFDRCHAHSVTFGYYWFNIIIFKMTTAQLVETAVIVSNIPLQDYVDPEDHITPTFIYDMAPVLKPVRIL